MLVLVTLMIASLGSLITGSATSSTDTLRRPCQVTAFTSASRLCLTPIVAGQMRASLRPHLQHAPYDPRRTRHVTGLRARKKCNHSGDFASIAGSSERDAESLRFPRVLVLLASHRRGDLAGVPRRSR